MKKKKGFTLVELLVVIAILAVLATVSVVGYMGFTKKAQVSNDTSLVSQLNTLLKADEAINGKAKTPTDVLKVTEESGYNVEKLTPTTDKYNIVWNQEDNQFALLDVKDSLVYGTISKKLYMNWKFADSYVETSNFSYYLKGDKITGSLNIKAGLDVGNNTGITKINYIGEETGKDKVVIRTNSYTTDLEIDAINDNIIHYALLGNLTIENVKDESYHEFGKVKNVSIKNGRFVAEEGSELGSDVTKIEGGSAIVETTKSSIWEDPTYTWSDDNTKCTATRKDKNGIKADEVEEVTVVVEVTKEATETDAGRQTYTAIFENFAFETQTKIEVIPSGNEIMLNSLNANLKEFELKNNRKPYTMHEALSILGSKRETLMNKSELFLWDSKENKFCTIDDVNNIIKNNTRNAREFWKITKKSISSSYSNYLADDFASTSNSLSNIRTGLDVGNYSLISSIKLSAYTNKQSGEFIIRTNGNECLTLDLAETIIHYGNAKKVDISGSKTSKLKYVENGIVTSNINISRVGVTVDLSLSNEKVARAIVVKKSDAIVIGNNKTPVCYTLSSKPNGISGADNDNDIGKVYAKGLELFDEGFGTSKNPFFINSTTEWNNVYNCSTTDTLYFKLKSNFTIESNVSTLAHNSSVVLDLNGHTITLKNDSVIQIGAKGLTIVDTIGNGGFIKSETDGSRGIFASFNDNASLNIENGIFNSNYLIGKSANTETKMTVKIKNGSFKLDSFIYSEINQTTLEVEGGIFNIDPTEYVDANTYIISNENSNWCVYKK